MGEQERKSRRQKMIDRATARAIDQVAHGHRPIFLRELVRSGGEPVEVWSVPSRSQDGQHWVVEAVWRGDTVVTACECGSGICWHRAAVRLAINGDTEYIAVHRRRRSIDGASVAHNELVRVP